MLAPRTALSIALLPVLAACATSSGSAGELNDLKAEVRALREENARIARQLERLEVREAVVSGVAKPFNGKPAAAANEVPPLTVVKLKPKAQAAPPLATAVLVAEPSPEILDELTAPARSPAADESDSLDPAIGDQVFENALTALKTGNVVGGVEKLQQFTAENPRHPKADNALYFTGVGLIGLGDYQSAAQAFETLIASYPAGDAVAEGMVKLAECRVRLNQPAAAAEVYANIVSRYPGTAAAASAQSRLASLGIANSTGSP